VQVELDLVHVLTLGADEGAEGVLGLDAHDTAVADGEKAQSGSLPVLVLRVIDGQSAA
jgi:hypothetical protein